MHTLFLTAEWRKLAMVNYLVDPGRLQKYVPQKTELDSWNGQYYVSLVAFMFQNTTVKGCRIPYHINFEEVNLRFYVKYKDGHEWKRGVVFIREYVPLPMVTLVANSLYEEHYQTVPMQHRWVVQQEGVAVRYSWKRKEWHSLMVEAENNPALIQAGSEEEFITQHFWGYSQKKRATSEYHVQHELWQAYPVRQFEIDVNFSMCYGDEFAYLNDIKPHSVYLVEGSPVKVYGDRFI
jgi:uncharacterized protein YqjF (DUF2071 family)